MMTIFGMCQTWLPGLLDPFWFIIDKTYTLVALSNALSKNVLSSIITFVFHQCNIAKLIPDVTFTIIDIHTIQVDNVDINTKELIQIPFMINLPFVIRKASIKYLTFRWCANSKRFLLSVDTLKIVLDVSDVPLNLCASDSSVKFMNVSEETIKVINDYEIVNESNVPHETLIVKDIKDLKDVITCYLIDFLHSLQVIVHNVHLQTISDLTVMNTDKHTMNTYITRISNDTLYDWTVQDLKFFICPDSLTTHLPDLLIMFKDSYLCVDFSHTSNVVVSLCGDSGFIFSCFLQQLLENQRIVNKILCNHIYERSGNVDGDILDEHVFKNIAKDLADTMQTMLPNIMTSIKKTSKSDIEPSEEEGLLNSIKEIIGIKMKHLQFTLEIHKGSDLLLTRDQERFTLKFWEGSAEYDIQKERLFCTVSKVQTTIGYIDEPIIVSMTNIGGYWDLNAFIPKIHIRTSQHIVEKTIILFNFNLLWNEYDLVYNTSDSIRFRTVSISDISMNFIYYNSPTDYHKILKGNYRYLIKLLPHCNFSIVFPSMILKYQEGWEDLFNAYVKELLTTQKFRCVKKVIVGTAKKKIKSIIGM